MNWQTMTLACLLVTAITGGNCPAAGLALQSFLYEEGFEAAPPKVELWAKNGAPTVNFVGPSQERAHAGRTALKLDVTLAGGTYCYWGTRVKVPCEGKLRLSAWIFVAPGTTAHVGFGTNLVFPPTHHSGCGSCESFSKPTGQWKRVECDLVARGREGASNVIANHAPSARGDEVGAVLDRWAIFVSGSAGQRAVVYLDDVRIEGQVPSEQDYRAEVQRRWATGQQRFAKQLAAWRADLASGEQALAEQTALPAVAREALVSARRVAAEMGARIDELARRGYASRAELDDLQAASQSLRYAPETIRGVAHAQATAQPYLIYAPRAIANDRLSSDTFPLPAPVAKGLSCSACRGEYEPLSAAVYALADIKGLTVSASDLTGPDGTIPAAAVDLRVVKCWCQAGREIWDTKHKVYVPELLLKDDKLVRVDPQKQENYLRSTAADGSQEYLLCSGPASENLANVRPLDTAELQPVDIAARSLKQFWITVHIPARANAGTYRGLLRFRLGQALRELPLAVSVYPFDLAPPRLIYSIYYRATLAREGAPAVSSDVKSEGQYRKEMENLKTHGVLYPTNYQGWDEPRLTRTLELRKEAGLPGGPFFNLGRSTGATNDPKLLDALQRDVKRWLDFCRPFGYDTIYFYGSDEATGGQLLAQRTTWRAVQTAGGRTFVACYEKTFEAMGDRLNCAVLAGRPNPGEARKWHSVGSQAFCYAYPQVGNEEPETYRRHYGLELWKAGFDGAMDYAYQHGFGHVWNDFDSPQYRDHVFAYPTVNGVVDTVQWEGFREAVDDMRYLSTLQARIEQSKAIPARRPLAEQAEKWLAGIALDADLDRFRGQMAEWIVRLGNP